MNAFAACKYFRMVWCTMDTWRIPSGALSRNALALVQLTLSSTRTMDIWNSFCSESLSLFFSIKIYSDSYYSILELGFIFSYLKRSFICSEIANSLKSISPWAISFKLKIQLNLLHVVDWLKLMSYYCAIIYHALTHSYEVEYFAEVCICLKVTLPDRRMD